MSKSVTLSETERIEMDRRYREGGLRQMASPVIRYDEPRCPHADCFHQMQWIDFRLEDQEDAGKKAASWIRAWWEGSGFAGRCPRCRRWIRFTTLDKTALTDDEASALPQLPDDWHEKAQFAATKIPAEPPRIINRGRGPEIAGTRITVYDVLDYHLDGWSRDRIAVWFRLSSLQVQAALDYIEEHKEEVMANYQKILDRCARGNPPEVQAKLDAIQAKYQTLWADKLKKMEENSDHHEGDFGG